MMIRNQITTNPRGSGAVLLIKRDILNLFVRNLSVFLHNCIKIDIELFCIDVILFDLFNSQCTERICTTAKKFPFDHNP